MEDIATALRVLREAKGINQPDLAELSGLNRGLISKYETGTVEPRIGSVAKLLAALGVDWSAFDEALKWVHKLRQPPPEEPLSYLLVPVTAAEARFAAGRPAAITEAISAALRLTRVRTGEPSSKETGSSEAE